MIGTSDGEQYNDQFEHALATKGQSDLSDPPVQLAMDDTRRTETPYQKIEESHGISHPQIAPLTPLKSGTNPNVLRPPTGNNPESIYSPAIIHQNGTVHMGDNHGEAYRNSYKDTGVRPIYTENGQGFVTSTGRYVDRKEAVPIAEKAGQVVPTDKLDRLAKKSRETFGLTSEDIEMGPLPTHDSQGWITSHGRKYYDENITHPSDPVNK